MEPQLPKSNPTEPSSLTDEALFDALKKGNSYALNVLFNRYGRLVYGLALKILGNSQEAEDLTQDVFLALWRNASRYPDCRYFVRYLVSMTRSRSLDKLSFSQPTAKTPRTMGTNHDSRNILSYASRASYPSRASKTPSRCSLPTPRQAAKSDRDGLLWRTHSGGNCPKTRSSSRDTQNLHPSGVAETQTNSLRFRCSNL